MVSEDWRETLTTLWWTGVDAVGGYRSVEAFLSRERPEPPTLILAVGKAAEQMYLAAADRFGREIPYFIATKYGHLGTLKQSSDVICAGHPTPDDNSIRAGRELMRRVQAAEPQDRLLFLVSGGASAIAELPTTGLTLDDIIRQNDQLIAAGIPIGDINIARQKTSRIKAGKLLSHYNGASILTLGLSDVEGDGIGVIGSGIGALNEPQSVGYRHEIVASNQIARQAVAQRARAAGLVVRMNIENLYCDIATAGTRVAESLSGAKTGVWIFGGEPTVILPDTPGKGGRNQALALVIAREIAGMDGVHVLVAGTDGTDGPTDAAGAFVNGTTWGSGAEAALDQADAWSWLGPRGNLFVTGPTGTNVMDLVIAVKT